MRRAHVRSILIVTIFDRLRQRNALAMLVFRSFMLLAYFERGQYLAVTLGFVNVFYVV